MSLASRFISLAVFFAALGTATGVRAQAENGISCSETIVADVVVFDNPTVFNRLGAQNPNWITYALKRDVVAVDPVTRLPTGDLPGTNLTAGNVELRPDKRPRPLVIRSIEGACLTINFENLLNPIDNPNNAQQGPPGVLINNDQVAGRCAGFHAAGVELVNIANEAGDATGNDGSMVGRNPGGNAADCDGGLVGPGGEITYHLYTPHEGAYVINSYGATLGSEANSGNLAVGMFGALNVEPAGAKIYRSQVTEEEMRLATVGTVLSDCAAAGVDQIYGTGDDVAPPAGETVGVTCNPGGQPIVDYESTYPSGDLNGNGIFDPAVTDGTGAIITPAETATIWDLEGKGGLPILNMLTVDGVLVHSDINAIIAGPEPDGSFPPETYPLTSDTKNNPQLPNRLEPFREFTSVFHDEQTNSQVFPMWYNDPVLGYTLAGVKDQFMINYGVGGIGSEIIANRLRTGPMHDCTDCAYEEFFLSSSTVGDPALLVNFPANTGIENCDPKAIAGPSCWRDPVNLANGPVRMDNGAGGVIENFALYQEDPSNVHHAYTGDFTKIRNTHSGSFEQHIFHLHNHQWLFNPNDDNANYLDAQEIMPGSGHTYELVNGGVGNRNKTAGDAIFHCHFYPHFAQGMWYHIRIMDVMETGSLLAVSTAAGDNLGDADANGDGFHDAPFALRSGQPALGARALPDGELPTGVPIPAIVPLPGKAMPQMPADVQVAAVDRGGHSLIGGRTGPDGVPDSSQAFVDRVSVAGADGVLGTQDDLSPGYPFWIAGNECGPEADFAPAGAVPANPDPDGNPATPDAVCPQGIVGQRLPTPPLDMLTEAGATANGYAVGQAGGHDGGLPRHSLLGYVSGGLSADTQNRLDFRKVVELARPVFFPEIGTDLERVSMTYHGTTRMRPSAANNLIGTGTTAAGFVQNGAPPVPGGPFQDPCVDDQGDPLTAGVLGDWFDGDGNPSTLNTKGRSDYSSEFPRTYKLANIQIDAVFNKVGYHYPQERIIALWEDVQPTIDKLRPPEPLVMRFNTFDCGKLLHTNLVPHEYELDDFQVRTPTDIIGQHIHLPKWDLTTNDGAANGWNYEDGALAPGIVRERIKAINEYNHLVELAHTCPADDTAGLPEGCGIFVDPVTMVYTAGVLPAGTLPGQLGPIDLNDLQMWETIDTGDPGGTPSGMTALTAAPHPFFETGVGGACDSPDPAEYCGARTVIQRMLIDPVVNISGKDRGLGLTFSHDHYGPSTFQQIGLYSSILAEPAGSTWRHNESGVLLGDRADGGPTSWQAVILTPDTAPGGSTVQAETIPDHREFYFEMSDFQHAYEAGVYVAAGPDGRPKPEVEIIRPNGVFDATSAEAPLLANTWKQAVNPPLKLKAAGGFPDVVTANPGCPGPGPDGLGTNNDPNIPRPCAEAINISHASMWVTNYRNEPVGLRVFDPNKVGPDGNLGAQTDGPAGDLALAFQTRNDRAISELNTRGGLSPYTWIPDYCDGQDGDGINCDRGVGDPFTPIMRAYDNDHIKIKIQVGATEEQHQVTVHGMKWLSNGSGFGESPNSGWRNFQSHGISEQFSLQVPLHPDLQQAGSSVDYLYATDATRDGAWSGTWGLLRTYRSPRGDLYELPDNPQGQAIQVLNEKDFDGVCPKVAPMVSYDVTAVLANEVLPNAIVDAGGATAITIPPNTQVTDPVTGIVLGGDSDGDGVGDNAGGLLRTDGGTLVYNRRLTNVPTVNVVEAGVTTTFQGGDGPLNDPTAMLYVRTEELISVAEATALENNFEACFGRTGRGRNSQVDFSKFQPLNAGCPLVATSLEGCLDQAGVFKTTLHTCPVVLRPNVPVEPLVLRANAGDCIDVTLRNRLVNQPAVTTGGQAVVDSNGLPVWFDLGEGKREFFVFDAAGTSVCGGQPCTAVALAEIIFDLPPDLPGWQDVFWVVNRNLGNGVAADGQMHFFNNNLIRPSSYAGLHPQLVEYDSSRDEGVLVGRNQGSQIAAPGGTARMKWYAGDLDYVPADGARRNRRGFEIVATPIEFGGTNLLSADRVKQPQKGLFGALVIEPPGSVYPDALADLDDVPDGQGNGAATRKTRAQVTIERDPDLPPTDARNTAIGYGGTYREALAIGHRIANLRWADGSAIANIHQGELGREGAEDSGHAGFNYGMEPSWFRFQLPPDSPFGNAGTPNSFGSIPNVHAFYANTLVELEDNAIEAIPGVSAAGDPQTPVFRTTADPSNPVFDSRIHLLNGASADRDGTFILHGHLWQRDPYVCPWTDWDPGTGPTLYGRCDPAKIGSQGLGYNPLGKWMGSEEGMGHVYGYWPLLFDAGGTDHVPGDYLFRDYSPGGNRNGQFGILRVESPNP